LLLSKGSDSLGDPYKSWGSIGLIVAPGSVPHLLSIQERAGWEKLLVLLSYRAMLGFRQVDRAQAENTLYSSSSVSSQEEALSGHTGGHGIIFVPVMERGHSDHFRFECLLVIATSVPLLG
jgi:hypothetical protein